jgi:hypothetical protein
MSRVMTNISTAALALVLGLGLTAGSAGAQPMMGPGGGMPGMRGMVRIDHNLQRRLWGHCQALRAELGKAHPDEGRVRSHSEAINRLWSKLTRQWYAERPGQGQAGGRGSSPGFAPGPGVRIDQALGASNGSGR